ncbi:MAG: fumarylacetoacetate hydrolase family protein [Robiginitomaculum sp.]|nr:fumarylacetoacetate hydrolase family protein [Robiginitomaculum sp.]
MRFRKAENNEGFHLECFSTSGWKAVRKDSANYETFLAATGQNQVDTRDPKPFAPKSYRDFMLSEQHYINAASNYAKSARPSAYRLTQIYKKLTGKTHPKLKPAPLWYTQPIFYMGGHMNFYGEGADIIWPDYSSSIDYELEIGFVLAKPLYNATPDEAQAAIGGFVVFNDFSARDVQMPEMDSGFGPQKSKHFANAISADFVTADEILPRINELAGSVSINGKQVCAVSSAGMQYTLGEALAHVSRCEHLYPGEFFATGTLPGGCGLENGHFLNKGDIITIVIEGIGSLTNKII